MKKTISILCALSALSISGAIAGPRDPAPDQNQSDQHQNDRSSPDQGQQQGQRSRPVEQPSRPVQQASRPGPRPQHGPGQDFQPRPGSPLHVWNPPAPIDTDTGLGLNGYCASIYAGGYVTLNQNNAYGWSCIDGNGNPNGIDMGAACEQQHGLPNAAYSDFNDPYSWYCTD